MAFDALNVTTSPVDVVVPVEVYAITRGGYWEAILTPVSGVFLWHHDIRHTHTHTYLYIVYTRPG